MLQRFSMIAVFLMIFSFSTVSYATNGMRLIGFGAVQDSMGGASVGANLDAASVLTNPAGIQSLGGRVDFGASYFSPDVSVKMGTSEFTSDKGPSPIPAFGLIIPLMDNLSFGIGAYGVSGMGVDYNMSAMNAILNTSYSLMRFAPGLSYKINDMVSVGATANLMYAQMEYTMNNGGNQAVNMGAAAMGYGATIGVTVKPVEILTVGLAYETTSKFQDFKFNQYVDAGATAMVTKNTLKFDQPMNATLGFALSLLEKKLILALDVQWIKWSETNGNDLPEFTGGNFDMQWKDQIIYKAGVQYDVLNKVLVRMGVNYGKMPLSTDNQNALTANMFFPAVAEWHYTGGLGIKMNDKLAVNIGGMYSPEAKVDSFMGESKMSQYAVDMGIAYKFQ